jgi:endonuclease/exonuclease/phosphatase family metal-dependent hydrolase
MMRLIRWIFAATVFAGLALGCSREEPQQAVGAPQLKVMTFNIARSGAETSLSQVAAAIRTAGADVVGLQQADGSEARIADMLHWDYVDERLHVISRYPLFRAERDGVDFAYVEVAPGEVVAVANVQLPSDRYGPYAVRDGAEAEKVLQIEAETRMPVLAPVAAMLPALAEEKVPTFLIGHFNAPSHLDWTKAASKAVAATKYPLQWPESALLADKGFVDSYRALYPDPVAKPGITWTSGYPHPTPKEGETFDRIDFVYAIGPAKPIDSKMVGEDAKLADLAVDPWPSDHRAVVSAFEIEPAPAPDLAIVEPSRVAFGDEFTVRVTMQKHKGAGISIFSADAGEGALAVTSQPLDGSDRLTAEFGTARLKPGRYFAAITDAAGKQLAKAEFQVTEPTTKPRIHVAQTGIYPGDPIKVAWMAGSRDPSGWIGIYKVGEPNLASHLARIDTDAQARGRIEIEAGSFAKPLAPGKYEVRLMRSDSYVELANAAFVVANPDAKPEVSVDPARIRLGEPITVSFKDAPGMERDRIGLYKAGDPNGGRYLTYLSTGGAISGQVTFDERKYGNKLTPGEYMAKLVTDGQKEIASARFWVTTTDGAPLVTVAKPRIKAGDPIEVSWASAPADEHTWVGIYKAGDPDHALVQRPSIATDGVVTFKAADFDAPLEPGDYKVRMMRADHTTELASAAFTVLDPNAVPQVTLAKSSLKAGEQIKVSWKLSPGNRNDWIGIYKADVSDTHNYIMWLYTKGAIDGEVTFTQPLPPGQYVARLLIDNGYEEAASSAPFKVTAP